MGRAVAAVLKAAATAVAAVFDRAGTEGQALGERTLGDMSAALACDVVIDCHRKPSGAWR